MIQSTVCVLVEFVYTSVLPVFLSLLSEGFLSLVSSSVGGAFSFSFCCRWG